MPNDPLAIPSAATERAAQLRVELARHNHAYYVLDNPTIPDAEYDKLFRQLQALELAHPALITSDSPTQRVGDAPRSDLRTVPHVVPMMSLDNTYNDADLAEFERRVIAGLPANAVSEFCVEPKLDGGSVEILYRDGQLVGGSTRGDGISGGGGTCFPMVLNSSPTNPSGVSSP